MRSAPGGGRLLVLAQPHLESVVRSRLSAATEELEVRPLAVPAESSTDPFRLLELAETEASETAGILVVPPTGMGMSAVAPAPAVHGVPVGVMPADTREDLIPWLEALRHRGNEPTRRTVVLSMWKPFYLNWAQRLAVALHEGATCEQAVVETWFADDVLRDDLCQRLATGPGLVFYVGHGRSGGWSGYKGLRWRHLEAVPADRPVGTLISLTCSNLGMTRDGELPFGVRWVRSGRACAFMGAVDSLDLRALGKISQDVMAVLRSGVHTLGAFVAAVDARIARTPDESVHESWARLRIVGSPLQPL